MKAATFDDAIHSDSGGIRPGRGGFMRGTNDVPYIVHPTETTKHQGLKADLIAICVERGIDVPDKITVDGLQQLLGPKPKRVAYGSPSGAGKLIESTFNLERYGLRKVIQGFGANAELADACAKIAHLDFDSDGFKTAADEIIGWAKDAARSMLAADRGTHAHNLSELVDEGNDIIAMMEQGQLLGIDGEAQQLLVRAWLACLATNGLEILAVEASCVHDDWRLAGTLDRIVRLTKDLLFVKHDGTIVTVPAGTVLILDIKSGQIRYTNQRDNIIAYWQGYGIQIAAYAGSVPYDVVAETRGEWSWPIDQDHALIAHLDVLAAIEGEARCNLIYVDIAAARDHGAATVLSAKEWNSRTDLFSVAQLDAEPQPAVVPTLDLPPMLLSDSAPNPGTVMAGLGDIAPPPDDDAPKPSTVQAPPTSIPMPVGGPSRAEMFEAFGISPDTKPDEGGPHTEGWEQLLEANTALDDTARTWVADIKLRATQNHVDFMAQHGKTVRRYHLNAGLVHLAANGFHNDDIPRAIVAHITNNNMAHNPNTPIGLVVGHLNAEHAQQFNWQCHQLVDGAIGIRFNPDGTCRLAAT